MRIVLAITLLLLVVLPVFASTHYFIEKDGESEAFLKLDKQNQELIVSLEMNGTKEVYRGLHNKGRGDLVNIDSTSTLKLEFKGRMHEVRIKKDEAEYNLEEIALEYAQNRKLNRLSSDIKYPEMFNRNKFTEQVELNYSKYFEDLEREFWLEGENSMITEPNYFIGYDIMLNAELEMYQPDLISISFMDYRYTGGAHGNYSFNGLNYYWKNDDLKMLNLEDIISGSHIGDLSDLCISRLKDMKADDVLKGNKIEFNMDELSEFSFSRSGMTFYFSPYQLDCYAAGDFKVVVPWKEVKKYINNDSPLYRFVQQL